MIDFTSYSFVPAYMPQPGGGGNSFLPYPAATSSFPPYPTSNFDGGYPPYPPTTSTSSPAQPTAAGGYPPYIPYPPTGSGYNTPYPPATLPSQESFNQTGTITEQHIKASLISAVEDKLRRRIQEKVNQCYAEIQTLKRTKQELTEGKSKINEIISKLEREEQELKKNISVLEDKDTELEKAIENLTKSEEIDVDEAVITTAPLYRQ